MNENLKSIANRVLTLWALIRGLPIPLMVETIIDRPMFALAHISIYPDGSTLGETYVSRIIEPTDSIVVPAIDKFREYCFSLVSEEVVEDEYMMGGSGIARSYNLYRVCPGQTIEHHCLTERQDKE